MWRFRFFQSTKWRVGTASSCLSALGKLNEKWYSSHKHLGKDLNLLLRNLIITETAGHSRLCRSAPFHQSRLSPCYCRPKSNAKSSRQALQVKEHTRLHTLSNPKRKELDYVNTKVGRLGTMHIGDGTDWRLVGPLLPQTHMHMHLNSGTTPFVTLERCIRAIDRIGYY